MRDRSKTVALALSGVVGLAAFTWPLIVSPDSGIAHGGDAPWTFALLLPIVLAVVLAELSEGGMDSKAFAMLGVLSALGAGAAGIETVFFLVVLGGRVFGRGFGFVLGNTTLFASALLTGDVGPWLPLGTTAADYYALRGDNRETTRVQGDGRSAHVVTPIGPPATESRHVGQSEPEQRVMSWFAAMAAVAAVRTSATG
jgi:hypothetical protein